MTFYRVVTGDNAWIDRFETEGEALICADQNPGSRVEEAEGEMPPKLTVEDARQVLDQLQRDTPENRRRQAIMQEFFQNHPAIQSLNKKFGTDSEGGCTD